MTAAAAVGDDPLVATLLQRIQQDLDAHLFANACFLAERLAAHVRAALVFDHSSVVPMCSVLLSA